MSLTSGRGPLSGQPAGRFVPQMNRPVVYLEPVRRRVRGIGAGGRSVVDSQAVLLVHRPGCPPEWAFPAPHVNVPGARALPEAEGYVTLPWDAADAWYEEEEQVLLHPRNPYHRVDCLRTSRRLRVEAAGTVIVDTTRTIGVYETALEPRLYVSRDQVRGDVLAPSATTTYCPNKGTATYWNLVLGDTSVPDAAWSYEEPLAESAPIRGHLCFDPKRVAVVEDIPED